VSTERYLGVKLEETRTAIEALDTPGIKALSGPPVSTIPSTSSGNELVKHSFSFN
jgi:hypothetical protein